eukprot:TRINITY_DN67252_c0_g1_i1.p2 TRINITY_DN67252_c0_g1~~TRINITY_DN67252_c0_g1_i1.p2  ORF type:complete len:202 (+),score=50.53 TRINITY_DN67252_c0_g1_i1:61-666(+)
MQPIPAKSGLASPKRSGSASADATAEAGALLARVTELEQRWPEAELLPDMPLEALRQLEGRVSVYHAALRRCLVDKAARAGLCVQCCVLDRRVVYLPCGHCLRCERCHRQAVGDPASPADSSPRAPRDEPPAAPPLPAAPPPAPGESVDADAEAFLAGGNRGPHSPQRAPLAAGCRCPVELGGCGEPVQRVRIQKGPRVPV